MKSPLVALATKLAWVVRIAAFAVCSAPAIACIAVIALGQDALRPWRDWLCALPFGLFAGACVGQYAFEDHWGAGQQTYYLYVPLALLLAAASARAYLTPRLWIMWLIAAANFAYFFLLIVLVTAIDGKNASFAPWGANWDYFFHIMLLAPVATHVAKLAARRLKTFPDPPPPAAPTAA